ncbi:MAG: hypothetical protein M1836_007365 [Candelina mexicana]|nr:MAG: hypothetical protein M1836_007365 [Candelina mexicana]
MASSTPIAAGVDKIPSKSILNLHQDSTNLKSFLAEHSALPTDAEIENRQTAFAQLKSLILPRQADGGPVHYADIKLTLVPIGSYGLGVWTATSDIDCLCIGSISTSLFVQLARQRLKKAVTEGVRILRTIKSASGTYFELEIKGVLLNLQYCPATEVVESWPRINQASASDSMFNLPVTSRKKLNAWRDNYYLTQSIPDIASFRLAHRFLRLWAAKRGILSTRFGYLSSFHISLMLSRVCKLLTRDTGNATAPDIVRTFFHYYASFDFAVHMVFDPDIHAPRPRYQRSSREHVAILTLHAPVINAAYSTTMNSVTTLVEELKRADRLMSYVDTSWSDLISSGQILNSREALPGGSVDFIQGFKSYIKIDVQYWGPSSAKLSTLLEWLESKCVSFNNDLNSKLPDVYARFWPARFVDADANGMGYRDHRAFYLIGLGLSHPDRPQHPVAKDDKHSKAIQKTLHEAIQNFTERIRSDERSYDATSSWMDCTVVRQADLGAVKLDDREWGRFVVDDDDEDGEEAQNEEPELDDDDGGIMTFEANDTIFKKPKKSTSTRTVNPPVIVARKLRPAIDVLNRLRWDPTVDESDYLVGYEDRFLGIREIPLDRWKGEQTDDEFIPQHRIVHFKRKSDGEVVWEKERRLDRVFGSGAL